MAHFMCKEPDGKTLAIFSSEKLAKASWKISYSAIGGVEFRDTSIGVEVTNKRKMVGTIEPVVESRFVLDHADHL